MRFILTLAVLIAISALIINVQSQPGLPDQPVTEGQGEAVTDGQGQSDEVTEGEAVVEGENPGDEVVEGEGQGEEVVEGQVQGEEVLEGQGQEVVEGQGEEVVEGQIEEVVEGESPGEEITEGTEPITEEIGGEGTNDEVPVVEEPAIVPVSPWDCRRACWNEFETCITNAGCNDIEIISFQKLKEYAQCQWACRRPLHTCFTACPRPTFVNFPSYNGSG